MMKRKILSAGVKIAALAIVGMAVLSGCSKKSKSAGAKNENVLRVGMECAYAPFNWTQDTDKTPDGSKAEPIYGTKYFAYGYDVAVAQMLAEKLGMSLEIHKSEWSSIGISMDVGDYDCIIAGMGKTAERELAYSFTTPYYYRSNCIVVKKGGAYDGVKTISDMAGKGWSYNTTRYRLDSAFGSGAGRKNWNKL